MIELHSNLFSILTVRKLGKRGLFLLSVGGTTIFCLALSKVKANLFEFLYIMDFIFRY